ncbi:MAG: TonB-dependent hemoglobin/transferrin/lactoferrin family receptor [Bradyrhizobiaceae bacterium]|nr:MAG: TonB-dependent hemoglobin/transferrin/lactoferrin family receptor [Bradyrhizobiaceae bacterium]
MLGLNRRTRALLFSISVVSLGCIPSLPVSAQEAQAQTAKPQSSAPKSKRKKNAQQQEVRQDAPWQTAYAQVGAPTQQPLDTITVAASKTEERAIDALAPVSVMTLEQIQQRQASTVGGLIYDKPGVWLQNRGDEPSTSINIRGLQDFGRVAYIVDGARQNYQRTGHFANGSFFLNPELISGIDIVRGPTANIYGSGAIGGVASFRTKDIEDVVRAGETWGVDTAAILGTNSARALGSIFGGVHVNPNVDVFAGGTYSTQNNYKDGTGFEVANTWNRLSSGIGKLTVRPDDGHEIKLSTIFQQSLYDVGQPRRNSGDPNTQPPGPPQYPGGPPTDLNGGTSVYASDVRNYTTSLGWKYSEPDNNLFDWDSKIYWNRTESDQTKIAHTSTTSAFGQCTSSNPGNPISGCVGDPRSYNLDTYGFDVHNTSRAETGDWRHAFTYGFDGFQDRVATYDQTGNSNVTTPAGKRTVWGGFLQYKANYQSLLEVVSAVRYDNYELTSNIGGSSGDRFSPKISIGLLPTSVVTPYVSYAEGYRAPSITETLISGSHTSATPYDAFFVCPSGQQLPGPPGTNTSLFCFLPNPNLRPEVGKTKEIGFNVRRNDIFFAGDTFRGKFNVFRNDVDDYIDLVAFSTPSAPPAYGVYMPFYQYQNIAAARIEGFEAETMYDATRWYIGVNATLQRGKNQETGIGLYSVQPQKITTVAGFRFADNMAVFSASWTSVKGNTDIPANYLPATSYDLVNLYLTVKPRDDLSMTFSVENLLNQYYRPYAVPRSAADGETQNDALWASAGAGITFKGGLRYHFGG